MTTPAEAFSALRKAGLKPDDPDVVRLFDVSDPNFVAKAKAAKPYLFGAGDTSFDARVASTKEVEAQLAAILAPSSECAARRRFDEAQNAAFLAKHSIVLAAPPKEEESRPSPQSGTQTGTTSSTAKKPGASADRASFDARTAPLKEVEQRLAILTKGR